MERRKTRSLPPEKVKIAKERINILFNLAEKEFKKHPERSRRYVELARKMGMRCNIRLTKGQKRKFCKKCNQILIPKKTAEIKIGPNKKLVEIKCLVCGSVYRHPYAKI